MLIKQGQLKIKTIDGKIVAKPDLKTAAGNGVVRKNKVGKKGIKYRKIYETKESRYMYLMTDIVDFAKQQTIEKKSLDKTDVALAGSLAGLSGGVGTGFLAGEYLARNKTPKAKTKYGVVGALAGTIGLGGLAAYQNIRNQKKNNAKL